MHVPAQRDRRSPEPAVRSARATDEPAVTPLLYESAGGMYDRFAGGRDPALRVLGRAFRTEGTSASADVVTVAEVGGRVAGALAAFPVRETAARAGAFLRVALATVPPWRWPTTLWVYHAGARASPRPPDAALYVDALATDRDLRRRGTARALLRAAEARARELRLPRVALDTALENRPARALYAGAGFEEVGYRPSGRGLPGFVALVKEVEA